MAGMKEKLKSIIGYTDEDYAYEEDEIIALKDADDQVEEVEEKTTYSFKEEKNMSNNVGGLKPKLVIHEPITYEDGPKILDDIKNKKIVVIDFETLDPDKKKQIFEFVNGGIYSMEAQIRKVTKDIFVVAPRGIDVEGKQMENFALKGDYNR